jgi:hypothetical protein
MLVPPGIAGTGLCMLPCINVVDCWPCWLLLGQQSSTNSSRCQLGRAAQLLAGEAQAEVGRRSLQPQALPPHCIPSAQRVLL